MRIGNLGPAAVLLAWTLAGCGGGGENVETSVTTKPEPAAPAKPKLSGMVTVDGSSTVFRISAAAQEAFMAGNSDVNVVVENHGTGGGFGRYLQGEVDIVDASRNAKPDEESKAKAQGLEWTRFIVGYDGITLVVNPKNTFVKSLTVAQLKSIWEPNSKVKTWKDVDPSWPDSKLVLYCPDKDSGTFEFFTEAVVGKARSQREDVQPSSDDTILVQGVAGDPDGLGYFGYAYFASNSSMLRALPIQKGPNDKPVMPDHQTILDKSYAPLSRPLYIFVKNSAFARPEVAAFLKYYLENVAKLSEKALYVAPTAEDQAANQKALAGLSASPTPSPTPAK
jgi:phosphate transport system substrate-binding protein